MFPYVRLRAGRTRPEGCSLHISESLTTQDTAVDNIEDRHLSRQRCLLKVQTLSDLSRHDLFRTRGLASTHGESILHAITMQTIPVERYVQSKKIPSDLIP